MPTTTKNRTPNQARRTSGHEKKSHRCRVGGVSGTLMKDLTGKEACEGATPAQLAVCRHCGARLNNIHLVPTIHSTDTKITLEIVACCPKCFYELDVCNVYAAFNGIGSWQVLKSHVG